MLLIGIGLAFAVVNGFNDGAAMVAASLKAPGLRPVTMVVVLAVALVVVPVVAGTRVAATLAADLVAAPPDARAGVLALGIVAATVVVAALSGAGLPTSLTLAVVGGIVGAGAGAGLPVSWATVGLVVLVGLAAPVVGALGGALFSRVPVWLALGGRRAHLLALALQSVAYAANDGQKMFALLGVAATSAAARGVRPQAWQLAAVALLFALGTVLGVRRAAQTMQGGLLRAGPREEVASEFSAAGAVLGSAALGAPVSMIQSLSGALIGAGLPRGYRQVRWRAAMRLLSAWVFTLPTSAVVAAVSAQTAGVAS